MNRPGQSQHDASCGTAAPKGASGQVVADWIAVDWGTSNLRAWAMGRDGNPRAMAASGQGMGQLARDGFEPALRQLIAPWRPEGVRMQVLACGMVGSRQGWAEAPYRRIPCPAMANETVRAPCRDALLDVRLVPGLCQDRPADVMRGEETQVAGFLSLHPGFDGVLCLTGTHSKWVHVSAGEVVSFRSFMTGELFALLSGASVLRHAMAADGWDAAAFEAALDTTRSHPERLAGALFTIRAEGLLRDQSAARARATLSGLLIGAELAAARPYWLGQPVAVIGAAPLAGYYARALGLQGNPATTHDQARAVLAGLTAIHARHKERS